MRTNITGIGEILWDVLPKGRKLGGAPTNFAYHANALGANASIISCIGNDDDGKDILRELSALSLDGGQVQTDNEHDTGKVIVDVDKNGIPTYRIQENVAWDNIYIDEGMLDLAKRTDVVSFGTLAQRSETSRKSIHTFIKAMRKDSLRIFDINLRPPYYSRNIIETSLKMSNVLKLNDLELNVLSRMLDLPPDEECFLKEISKRYDLKLAALTKGGSGSILSSRLGVSRYYPAPLKIVDTVGAGDAFTAGLAMGMLKGFDLENLNKFANTVASFVCTKSGATPVLSPKITTALHKTPTKNINKIAWL